MRSEISLSFIVLIVIISEFNAICDDEKLENYNVTSNKANISDGVCNSLVCENAAKLIINGRNESVKPCDDFYSYVCGNWSNNYQIPENSKFIDVRTMAEMKLKTLVKEIIQQPVDFNDSKHLSLEKKWFNTCVDTDTILNSGQSLLMNISERIGGMPFTMNSSEWEIKNISWQEVDIYYTNLIGQSVFFNFEVVHYNGTPKLFLAKPKTKNISEKSHQILNFFANRTQLNISETDVHDIIILQQHLNEIIEHPDSILKNEVTLKNSQENYNTICPKFTNGEMDFLKIISALFNSTNLEVNENEFMYFNSRYFIKLCQLFRATTSKNIANYIHWSFLVDSFDYWYISDEMLIKENRVNQCFELMPFFKGYCSKIVDIYILNTTEDLIENIIPNTKTQLLKKISNSSWMSDSLFLKNKLENIEFQFAPIFEKDTQSPEGAHFYNYNIEVTNYFLQNWINLKNVKKLKIVKMMKTVSQDSIKILLMEEEIHWEKCEQTNVYFFWNKYFVHPKSNEHMIKKRFGSYPSYLTSLEITYV